MAQDRHPLLRHLSAAGSRQCAGKIEVHLPQQARRLLARHPEQGPVQLDRAHVQPRLHAPQRLAELLLAIDKGWDAEQVAHLLEQEPTDTDNGIVLDKHIPVHVTYFTVWADENGELDTRADVYGHEKRISLALQGKWSAINKGEDHLAAVEPSEKPKPGYRSKRRSWSGGGIARGPSGGGWSAPATRVSQGNSAHDIFRRGFGY
jgi:hypothetical protein